MKRIKYEKPVLHDLTGGIGHGTDDASVKCPPPSNHCGAGHSASGQCNPGHTAVGGRCNPGHSAGGKCVPGHSARQVCRPGNNVRPS
ncbi:MAG: hypothetical protein PHG91_05430 [Syntrophales bacterium]|jgi:hypothetical protein|nr:hypothetical protein [Syntrophales bacterium]MDD5232814.1 hypothetical protein [Syntrophales bacterium]MDD5532174.1 hypothetical protein [Syntrophales bacterium]HPL63689.1 hypothetical protein [Syntrophales bacterium]